MVAGQPITMTRLDFDQDSSELITHNDLHIFVIKRGSCIGVRIFDPENPPLKTFKGLRWFPVDPGYCVNARFIPFAEKKSISILDILGDINEMPITGHVEIELKGQKFCMQPFEREDGGLWLIFHDLTNGNLI
jgi:uncharacterized protein (DUF1684 family)